MMPSVKASRYQPPSVKQLKMVFNLCDPHNTGKVLVDHLQELAKLYTEEDAKDFQDVLKYFDPQEKGVISFRDFYHGVKAVLKRRHFQDSCKESMMTPSPVAAATSNGDGAMGTPRFLVTPGGGGAAPPGDAAKSQCSSLSDGESFECYGENGDLDIDSGVSSDHRVNGEQGDSPSLLNSVDIKRNTWLRTSLRRSPPSHQENLPNRRWGSFRHSGKRQLGSNALASQLYRSSSFNSSGRSSTCDTADDMYSDVSLDEDVHLDINLDINHKLQIIQQQMGVLTDSANHSDEKYIRAKAENAALQARVHMLEEQLRESEIRHDERLQDEQRRAKDLLSRVEREKHLQLENNSIRLQALELEVASLREEAARQRGRAERLEIERREFGDQLQEVRNELEGARDREHAFREAEKRLTQQRTQNNQLIDELSHEIERLRSESRTPALPTTSSEQLRLEELHQEISELRAENRLLAESNEELQAGFLAAGVEQGRLLTTQVDGVVGGTSLAAELEAMSHDQFYPPDEQENLSKIQQALKEQQDVNVQLRSYIDGILLNIVENYPQLLEVKQRSA